jgi:hypothetical protein
MNGVASGCLTLLAAVGFVVGGLLTAWGLLAVAVLLGHDLRYGSGATRYENGAFITVAFGVGILVLAFVCLRAARIAPGWSGSPASDSLRSELERLDALGIDVIQGEPRSPKPPRDPDAPG